jgi:hypothetical protein
MPFIEFPLPEQRRPGKRGGSMPSVITVRKRGSADGGPTVADSGGRKTLSDAMAIAIPRHPAS